MARRTASTALVLLLVACGGGGDAAGPGAGPPAATLPAFPARRASAATPVAPGCTGGNASGTVYVDAEVEPFAAVHPVNGNQLLAAWQQDRTSNGGSRALVSATSFDGGASWQRVMHPMSRCGGAQAGSAGDFERVSDPWVDFGPDGTAHAMGLAFSGASLQPGSSSAMLASRSVDGGLTWSAPTALVSDGAALFNDKNTLTADPTDARFVYAVWDRLDAAGNGPTLLARSADGGVTWEPARTIFAPVVAGGVSQTLGNRIVVLTGGPERGSLVNVFTQIDTVGSVSSARVALIRSSDRGLTWSAPTYVDELRAVGARNPEGGQPIRDGAALTSVATAPDGGLWIAWQDARFSGGQRDAIAISRSADGGRSWSAPAAINRIADTAAFTPTLHVRADGLVGVMHYDLRSNTADAATLLADAWLLTSRDGLVWAETRVHDPSTWPQRPMRAACSSATTRRSSATAAVHPGAGFVARGHRQPHRHLLAAPGWRRIDPRSTGRSARAHRAQHHTAGRHGALARNAQRGDRSDDGAAPARVARARAARRALSGIARTPGARPVAAGRLPIIVDRVLACSGAPCHR